MLRTTTAKQSPEPAPLSLDERILEALKIKENSSRTIECLAKHEIGPDHRAKMVCWMVEVLSQLGSATQTLFLSVRYMDLYFKRNNATLPLSQLHITGATSMFLASKFEDVAPMHMQTFQEDVVKKLFSTAKLKQAEFKMLQVLNFDIDVPTTLDFLGYLCEKLSVCRIVSQSAVNVAVIALTNYNGLRFSPSQQAAASLIIAATSMKQYKLISQVLRMTGILQSDIVPILEWMYAAVVQFPRRHPKLKAILACLNCTVVGKKPGPLFKYNDEILEAAQQALLGSHS